MFSSTYKGRKSFTRGAIVFLAVYCGSTIAVFAAFNDVVMTSSAIIKVAGINLNVGANATTTIQSIVVNPNSFDVTLAPGSSLSVVSNDSRNFSFTSTSMTVNTTCTQSNNTLTITAGSLSGTITVTPLGTTCTYAAGGGMYSVPSTYTVSSSGGGGSTSATPVTVATTTTSATTTVGVLPPTTASTTTVQASNNYSASSVVHIVAFASTKPLRIGSRGDDVQLLQSLLAKDATLYPSGKVNGRFGRATSRAVKLFQLRYNLAKQTDKYYGIVGPRTKAKLIEVFGN